MSVDLNQCYKNPNLYAMPNAPLILDRPDLQEDLRANGASVFNVL